MSSARAPFRRRLTAAQSGLDPLTHYWLKAGKNDYRRLCDDAPWTKGLRYERTPGNECQACRDVRYIDRQYGLGVFFSMTYKLRGVFAPSPGDVLYVPYDGLSFNPNGDGAPVTQVSMSKFTDFYVAESEDREKIVEDFHDGGRGFNPYGPLTTLLKRHLKSGDIEALREANFNLSPESSNYEARLATLERARQDCIAFWIRNQPASYFEVRPTGVHLDRLTVNVSPEIGMKTEGGERALRLWHREERLRPELSAVYHYLLARAVENMLWGGVAAGIWDVRRRVILVPPILPDDMASRVSDAALDFMRIWDSLPP